MRNKFTAAIVCLVAATLIPLSSFQGIRYNQISSSDRSGNSTQFQMAGNMTGATGATVCKDAGGNTTTAGCTGSAPSGTAGGDLSGTYPNPTVAKVNGTSIPTNAAADQVINTTASATAQWTSVPNCTDTGGNHLNYATSTHTLSCGTSSGGSGTVPTTGWTVVNGALFNDFLVPQIASVHIIDNASSNWRFITRTSANTYTVIATVSIGWQTGSNSSAYGLYVSDGTKFEGIEILNQTTANQLRVQRLTNVTTASTTVAGPTANLTSTFATFKIVQDSSHRTFYYWNNGAFTQFFQETNNTFLTEDRIGVGGISVVNNAGVWLQVTLWQWSLT